MGSGFDVWIYWRFFTIKISRDSSESMTVYDSVHSLLDHERLLFHCDECRTTNLCSHTELSYVQVKVKLMLRWTLVGQSVLEQSTHLGLTTRSLLLSDSCGFVDLGRPL
jgi:hypothetical protein